MKKIKNQILEQQKSLDCKQNIEIKSMVKNLQIEQLRKIHESKNHFQIQKQKIKQSKINQSDLSLDVPKIVKQKENIKSLQSSENINAQYIHHYRTTQSSNEQSIIQLQNPYFRQWTLGNSKQSNFTKFQEMIIHYENVFESKVKFSMKNAEKKNQSFKIDEKKVIQGIYQQIKDKKNQTVHFNSVIQFFRRCSLFYYFYNIHESSLLDLLKDSAKKFQQKLTKEEFMNIFLLNNRTNKDFENYNINQIQKRCLINQQMWKEMKEIFDNFDTFGNQTIKLQQFLNKFKINYDSRKMAQKKVLQFPSLQRSYTLEKIFYELENKLSISEKYITWAELRQLIEQFRHINYPTIDLIVEKRILSGQISYQTNTFMLKSEILNQLKQIFFRCPKYCENFVKVSNFCQQIFENANLKHHMNEIVRNIPKCLSFKQCIFKLNNSVIKYLDLDQILEWFSLKGLKESQSKQSLEIAFEQDTSDDQFQEIKTKKHQQQKHLQNVPKKQEGFKKNISKKNLTKINEFNLSKKQKLTIRQRKLIQTIKNQQQIQERQISKKFKANPIPASINNQKYLEYKQQMDKIKQSIFLKLNKKKEKQAKVLQYLQSNTMLFHQKSPPKNDRIIEQYVFEARPVPWYAQMELLDKINRQKEERKKVINRVNREKYLLCEWKNLPTFIQDRQILSSQGEEIKLSLKNVEKQIITVKPRPIPNFDELHKQFQAQLQRRKLNIKPTQIKQFNLSCFNKISKRDHHHHVDQRQIKSADRSKRLQKKELDNFIGSTLKYQSLLNLNIKKREQALAKQIKEQQDTEQRQKNARIFKKLMKKQMQKQFKKLKQIRLQLKKSHKNNYSSQISLRQNQKSLRQMYKRVFNRPFLFQFASNQSQKQKNRTPIKFITKRSVDGFDNQWSDIKVQKVDRKDKSQNNLSF